MRHMLLWVLPNNGYDTVPTVKTHLSGYLREHPGLSVYTKVRTQASLWEDLFRLIKNPHHRPRPDIVQIPSHWTSTLAHLGLLQDLKELDSQLDLRHWFLPVQENCRLEGTDRTYSLPWWMELRVLFYRESLLKKAGVAPESLKNWEGFKSACTALAGAGIKQPVANPNPRESVAMADLAPCIWSRGGDFFSKDGSRSLFQREDAYRAIGDYFELLDKGWMALKGQSGSEPKNLFEGGCALEFSGRMPRPLENKRPRRGVGGLAKDVGVVSYPAGGQRSFSTLQSANLAILKNVENPRDVYALLRELVRDDSAATYARTIGALPAVETELLKSLEDRPHFKKIFAEAMPTLRTFPNLRVLGTLEKVFNRSMERLVGDVLQEDYTQEGLRRELIHAAAEIDYVLSLYG